MHWVYADHPNSDGSFGCTPDASAGAAQSSGGGAAVFTPDQFGGGVKGAIKAGAATGLMQGTQNAIQGGIQSLFQGSPAPAPSGPTPEEIQQQQQAQQAAEAQRQQEAAEQAEQRQKFEQGKDELLGEMKGGDSAAAPAAGDDEFKEYQAPAPAKTRIWYSHDGAHRVIEKDADGNIVSPGSADAPQQAPGVDGAAEGGSQGGGAASGAAAPGTGSAGGAAGGPAATGEAFGTGNSKVRLTDGGPVGSGAVSPGAGAAPGGQDFDTGRPKKGHRIRHPPVAQIQSSPAAPPTVSTPAVPGGGNNPPTVLPPPAPIQFGGNVEAGPADPDFQNLVPANPALQRGAPGSQAQMPCNTNACGGDKPPGVACPRGYPYLDLLLCRCYRRQELVPGSDSYLGCQYGGN